MPKNVPTQSVPDRSTGSLIRKSFRMVNRALDDRLRPHGITSRMWFLLRVLWETDGLTQRELGDELDLGQPAMVSAIDTLEKRGLIERRRNAGDRRKTNIHLTADGMALRSELHPLADEVNAVAVSRLSSPQVATLWQLLDLVVAALDEDLEGG